jgi:hypothetical protein
MLQFAGGCEVVQRASNASFIQAGHPSNIFNTGYSEFRDCAYNGSASILAGRACRLSSAGPASAPGLSKLCDGGGSLPPIVTNDIALNGLPDALI